MYEISKQLSPTQYNISQEGLSVYLYMCSHTCAYTHAHTRRQMLKLKAAKLPKFIQICVIKKVPLSESITEESFKDVDINTAFEMPKMYERHNTKMTFKMLHVNM